MPKEGGFRDRLAHAWNAFKSPKTVYDPQLVYGPASSYLPMQTVMSPYRYPGMKDTIISAIYNRLAADISIVDIMHVRVDVNGGFLEQRPSQLNECLTVEANIDQTAREFIIDLSLSLFEEGVVAVVPVDTVRDPTTHDSFDIKSLRVARITSWMPRYVGLECYDDHDGRKKSLVMPKDSIAIITNPFYTVMNSPNGTLRRLLHKLSALDVIDDQLASNKLDLIIQLPYVIKSDTQRNQAEMRRQAIEDQLAKGKYGIAYTDGTERITQLNRPIENNLLSQVEYLTKMLYSQLGLTEEILNGTADENTMLNYYTRTINPFLNAICDEMTRKSLTKTARTQGQVIKYYREPFSLTTSEKIADLADRLTRNEILSPNEFRAIIGFKPVDDARANELRNRNLNPSEYQLQEPVFTAEEDGLPGNELPDGAGEGYPLEGGVDPGYEVPEDYYR